MSQLGLAIPTILLYEVSIITARMMEKRRAEREAEEDDEEEAEQAAAQSEADLEEQGRGSMP